MRLKTAEEKTYSLQQIFQDEPFFGNPDKADILRKYLNTNDRFTMADLEAAIQEIEDSENYSEDKFEGEFVEPIQSGLASIGTASVPRHVLMDAVNELNSNNPNYSKAALKFETLLPSKSAYIPFNNVLKYLNTILRQIAKSEGVAPEEDGSIPSTSPAIQAAKDFGDDLVAEIKPRMTSVIKKSDLDMYISKLRDENGRAFNLTQANKLKNALGDLAFITSADIEKAISDLREEAKSSGDEKFEYGFDVWEGAQKFLTDRPNFVIQLNMKPNYMNYIFSKMGNDFKEWYLKIAKVSHNSNHPVFPIPGHTIAWARVHELEPDTWLINEIQEDWGTVKATAKSIAEGNLETYVDGDGNTHQIPENVKELLTKPEQLEWLEYITGDLLLNYEKIVLRAILDLARENGVKHIYMLPDVVQTHIKGQTKSKILYHDLPKKFHFNKVRVNLHDKYPVSSDYDHPGEYWYRTAKRKNAQTGYAPKEKIGGRKLYLNHVFLQGDEAAEAIKEIEGMGDSEALGYIADLYIDNHEYREVFDHNPVNESSYTFSYTEGPLTLEYNSRRDTLSLVEVIDESQIEDQFNLHGQELVLLKKASTQVRSAGNRKQSSSFQTMWYWNFDDAKASFNKAKSAKLEKLKKKASFDKDNLKYLISSLDGSNGLDNTLEAVEIVLNNRPEFSSDTYRWAKDWKENYDEINDMETGHGDFSELDYYFDDRKFKEMVERDLDEEDYHSAKVSQRKTNSAYSKDYNKSHEKKILRNSR